MSLDKRIRNMAGNLSYEERMYVLLNSEKYSTGQYRAQSLGEGMAVIMQDIWGWWKPRFLLDRREQKAYEFMDGNEYLVTVGEEDIDWESLKGLPEEAVGRARQLSFHFPSFVHGYCNDMAEVSWQLNPDGRYYMDDDGFGMTDDVEITIYGTIDRTGKVVFPFRYIG